MKKAIVLGAGGFIGNHLVSKLKKEGFWVKGVDLHLPEFSKTEADEFLQGDLRNIDFCRKVLEQGCDELYQLAADMGGAGYIFSGNHDADIMHNSAQINLNVLESCKGGRVKKMFYSSSACVYPEENQLDPNNPNCEEKSAYPANPDSEYGWEKLFSERMFFAYARNYGLNVRVARFHNVFGPLCSWNDGREKSPAALCRKVAQNGEKIDIWGDGKQTRSFLYIDECLDGVRRFMDSEFKGPLNLGSEEFISIHDFAKLIMKLAGKQLAINFIPGPTGVRGRKSDNRLIKEKLNWAPSQPLSVGIAKLYSWIESEAKKQ